MTEPEPSSRFLVARYRGRLNRFVMQTEFSSGEVKEAFCPNTSRLIGLLDGNPRLLLTEADDSDRKTNYTVRGLRNNGTWVGIEALQANELFESYLESTETSSFAEWGSWKREVPHDSSQFDFYFPDRTPPAWVEVKSLSSRSLDGSAFYSGTPSRRGYRHLEHLGDLAEDGEETWCIFVVQRGDVDRIKEADVSQEDWMQSLRRAHERGVTITGYRCRFTGGGWRIEKEIPAEL